MNLFMLSVMEFLSICNYTIFAINYGINCMTEPVSESKKEDKTTKKQGVEKLATVKRSEKVTEKKMPETGKKAEKKKDEKPEKKQTDEKEKKSAEKSSRSASKEKKSSKGKRQEPEEDIDLTPRHYSARPRTGETMSLMTEAAIDAIAEVNKPVEAEPRIKKKKKKQGRFTYK